MLRKYTETELRATIQKQIDSLRARRKPVHPAWVTQTICKDHHAGLAYQSDDDRQTVEPEDVAFWRFCGYTHTRKLVTACINDLEPADTSGDEHEPFLPGFNLLRSQYVWRRDGVDVEVPTEQATVEELLAKAAQFERNSVTLAEHARELRRYAGMRAQEIAS